MTTKITEMVDLEHRGEIGLLWIDNPPVNALSQGVRQGLQDGVRMALDDEQIRALVIICRGRTFIAGADIREFGKPRQPPQYE